MTALIADSRPLYRKAERPYMDFSFASPQIAAIELRLLAYIRPLALVS